MPRTEVPSGYSTLLLSRISDSSKAISPQSMGCIFLHLPSASPRPSVMPPKKNENSCKPSNCDWVLSPELALRRSELDLGIKLLGLRTCPQDEFLTSGEEGPSVPRTLLEHGHSLNHRHLF